MTDATRDGQKVSRYSTLLAYWEGYRDAAKNFGAGETEMKLIEAIIESVKKQEVSNNVITYRGGG